jgi:hypothetical protein
MDYVLVAFSSRTDAIRFKDYVNRNGMSATLVSTPKETKAGCGLSVKIYTTKISQVKVALKSLSLVAVTFAVSVRGGHSFLRPL